MSKPTKQGARPQMEECRDYEAMARRLKLRSLPLNKQLHKNTSNTNSQRFDSPKNSRSYSSKTTKRVPQTVFEKTEFEARWQFCWHMALSCLVTVALTYMASVWCELCFSAVSVSGFAFLAASCWQAKKRYDVDRFPKVVISPQAQKRRPAPKLDPSEARFRPLRGFYKNFAVGPYESLDAKFEEIDGSLFPEPMRKLLVHTNNMTPTLGEFHKAKVGVRILDMTEKDMVVTRNIVLYVNDDEIIELGAINIYLENMLNLKSREDVRGGKIPFGTILANRKIRQQTGKQAFFVVKNDALLNSVLNLDDKVEGFDSYGYLYGRCNTILNHLGDPMCEVVEILPYETPVHPSLIADECKEGDKDSWEN